MQALRAQFLETDRLDTCTMAFRPKPARKILRRYIESNHAGNRKTNQWRVPKSGNPQNSAQQEMGIHPLCPIFKLLTISYGR
jgi:hypothetical protein